MSRIVNLTNKKRRKNRIRAKIFGTKTCPRLSVFKSNKYIYAQLIDDDAGKTIADFSAHKMSEKSKSEQAKLAGSSIAEKAISLGIKKVVFDRNGYIYTGIIKMLAESARSAGLKF